MVSVHCKYTLLSLVNKEANWPTARQDNQPEDTGMKRGGERESLPGDAETARWACHTGERVPGHTIKHRYEIWIDLRIASNKSELLAEHV